VQEYSPYISLTQNSRGVYSLDTSIGCFSGLRNSVNGCFNDCYAANSAKRYGYDFAKTILRDFKNEKHRKLIVKQINQSKFDFIRIGTSGDPSENWEHTINILRKIDKCNKQIVIVTKHWGLLNTDQLKYFATINLCVNTSVSALDPNKLLNERLAEFEKLKRYCKSILRVVTFNFNLENDVGRRLNKIQNKLLKTDEVLETVFRVSSNNPLITRGVIVANKVKFIKGDVLCSKLNNETFFGECKFCDKACGVNITPKEILYPQKRGVTKQLTLL